MEFTLLCQNLRRQEIILISICIGCALFYKFSWFIIYVCLLRYHTLVQSLICGICLGHRCFSLLGYFFNNMILHISHVLSSIVRDRSKCWTNFSFISKSDKDLFQVMMTSMHFLLTHIDCKTLEREIQNRSYVSIIHTPDNS